MSPNIEPAAIDPGISAIVAALLSGGGIVAVRNFRKAGKEADDIAANTLIAVVNELRTELARRDAHIEKQDVRIERLIHRAERLTDRVDELERELNKYQEWRATLEA